MALKAILVAASGGSASNGAVETACRIAQRVGAHLEGFHVKLDPLQVIMLAADGYNMPIAADWIDRLEQDSADLAAQTGAAFTSAARHHGLTGSGASWAVKTGYAPLLVAARARFFDLVVLGRSERIVNLPHSDTIEETLTRSGRPVLIAPAKAPDRIGEVIAVGWNGSVESVHAIVAALPLLQKARRVDVFTIEKRLEEDPLALMEYLAAHGIMALHREIPPAKGEGLGEQLLSEAQNVGADLLVMGAYGKRPWREVLFGGATRQVVGTSPLPVLLAH